MEGYIETDPDSVEQFPSENYTSLYKALMAAYRRAAQGKGKERHANGEPFELQPICAEARLMGPATLAYQIRKKTLEAAMHRVVAGQPTINEYLDVIVHAAALVIVEAELTRTPL